MKTVVVARTLDNFIYFVRDYWRRDRDFFIVMIAVSLFVMYGICISIYMAIYMAIVFGKVKICLGFLFLDCAFMLFLGLIWWLLWRFLFLERKEVSHGIKP